ncbi:hypothetical protein PIIN_11209 [Serendipita indica DSM 11827]|uniref:Uncharacterized protein n=1 Tax=Serendipita indica (strain DSM 11827) TaxID=1109443 RepID=G4U0Y3_SERID|nr:hypothetical protein PIIN_11209 [Serendipita indica DSM 11827]
MSSGAIWQDAGRDLFANIQLITHRNILSGDMIAPLRESRINSVLSSSPDPSIHTFVSVLAMSNLSCMRGGTRPEEWHILPP